MKNATYLKLVASAAMLTMGSYAFAQSDNNGNVAGWVWWQGSENPGSTGGVGEFALMNGLNKGKKYYVSKQFYRYIRPGAVRVGATSTNCPGLRT